MGESGVECPRCGFPADPAEAMRPEAVMAGLPEMPVRGAIDMHQILPAAPGALELQIAVMDALGIRRVLLQSVPDETSSLCGNAALREVRARYPDRFYLSQFTDPRHPQALQHLEAFSQAGVHVVKLLPCAGWSPDDPAVQPFFERMSHLGQIAFVHTGFITARHKEEERKAGRFLSSGFGRPILFDEVARRFPELQIIVCHMGGGEWYEEACAMVTNHENVWGDFAGPGIRALRRIVDTGAELDWRKVFWGNDAPAFAYPLNLRLQLGLLEKLQMPQLAAMLLHDNAAGFCRQFLEA
jgi:predicted TIM-barrel fold metal-dependent hydrolase